MTVIAYRDGVMAADSGSFCGGRTHGYARKVARGHDGTLYGVMGSAAEADVFLRWVEGGCKGEMPAPRRTNDAEGHSSFCILRVRPGADPELVNAYGAERFVHAPYVASGAAEDFAWGALHAGASAVAAVKAAIAHSINAAGPVRSISHEG